MIVVADTSPPLHLGRIGRLDLRVMMSVNSKDACGARASCRKFAELDAHGFINVNKNLEGIAVIMTSKVSYPTFLEYRARYGGPVLSEQELRVTAAFESGIRDWTNENEYWEESER